MIEVYFDRSGYYITGPNIEVAESFSPLTVGGEMVLTELQHLYVVLYKIFSELTANNSREDIIIYNDSRIVDDMNGIINPLDDICEKTRKYMKRKVIPTIKGIILFRKKSTLFIREKIENGQKSLIGDVDDDIKKRKISEISGTIKENLRKNQRNRIENFKQDWFRGE